MRYSRKDKLTVTLQEKLPAWKREEKDGNVRFTRGRISIEPDHYLGARLRVYLDGKRISTVRIPESSIRRMADSMKDAAILAYNLTAVLCHDFTSEIPAEKEDRLRQGSSIKERSDP